MKNAEYIKEHYSWEDLKGIIELLRSPDGCPWDSTQTYESMKKCVLDEANEVVTAVDNKDVLNLKEELGDLLLQVLLYSQIAKERGDFTLSDVIEEAARKMVRRHPNVFDAQTDDCNISGCDLQGGLTRWNYIKMNEKKEKLSEYRKLYEDGKITRELLEFHEKKYEEFLIKIGVLDKK